MAGEGAAIAQYVQANLRIPRRGEVSQLLLLPLLLLSLLLLLLLLPLLPLLLPFVLLRLMAGGSRSIGRSNGHSPTSRHRNVCVCRGMGGRSGGSLPTTPLVLNLV